MADANIRAVITAEDRASSVLKGFGNTASDVGDKVVTNLKRAAFAVGAVTAAVGTFAVKSASDFEQSRIAFETMLGSVDKAKKLLKDISDFAQKTPFELPQVVTGAKQLLAYNVSAEKLLPTLKMLGDISAGVGRDKLPDLIRAFGQVRAKGKLMAQELNQFAEAGVPLREMLAKELKISMEQFSEALDKGQLNVKFEQVEAALGRLTGEGGRFFNLMERQSKTFGGVMSNIKDAFGRTVRSIVGISDEGDIRQGSIFDRLSRGAQALLEWITAHQAQITAFFTGLVEGAIGVARNVRDMVELVITKWAELQAYLQNNQIAQALFSFLKSTLDGLWETITARLIPAMDRFARAFSPEAREAIKVLGALLVAAFGGVLWVLDGVLNKIADLLNKIAKVRESLGNLVNNFNVSNLSKLLGGLGDIWKPQALRLLPGFNAAGTDNWRGGLTWVGEKGPELINAPKGSQIIPNNKIGNAGPNSTVNVTFSGVFTGNESEFRKLAVKVFQSAKDAAGAKNQNLMDMVM